MRANECEMERGTEREGETEWEIENQAQRMVFGNMGMDDRN